MTGEGIAQAIETGMLAAEAIATGADYRRLVHRALGRDLRFAQFLQRVLRHPLGARAAIGAADLTPWTRRNFARWMWEDYPRALLGTPDRWRRGAFSAPGCVGPDTRPHRRMHDVAMAEGKAEVTIDRSPDEVWKLFREFGGLETWMPGVETCTVDGDVRTIGLMGIEIKEQLRDRDDDGPQHLVLR